MKKLIIIFLILLSTNILIAEEPIFEVLGKFSNNYNTDSLFRRSEDGMDMYDDYTGNNIFISDNGEIYIQNIDHKCIYQIIENDKLSVFLDYKNADIHKSLNLIKVYDDGSALFASGENYIKFIDKNARIIFNLNRFDSSMNDSLEYPLYLETEDILLLWSISSFIGCITDVSKVKNSVWTNFKSKDEAIALFKQTESPDLYLDKDCILHYNGKKILYRATLINNMDYYTSLYVNWKMCIFSIMNGNERIDKDVYDYSEQELVESLAIHPSGDLYFLRFNNTTKLHILYRIENTWDPQWRKEWYKAHEESQKTSQVKTSSVKNPSLNVAVNKTMSVKENLRLRSGEATSSSVVTTMQSKTKVKILELGKTETIDGITSAWVNVEIISGTDRDGKTIKKGTTGWCFGGYLE